MKTRLLLMLLLFFSVAALSQSQYHLAFQSKFIVSGTYTMHDWTMVSKIAEGKANLIIEGGKLISISQLKVTVPAESLKSGKNTMDKNAYDALKTDQHPTIQFDLAGVEQLKQEDESIIVACTGNLTIAGITKKENLMVVCRSEEDGSLSCQGSKSLKMSSYGVEPPTFMFGTIKTGDEITVAFNLQFHLNKRPLNRINHENL